MSNIMSNLLFISVSLSGYAVIASAIAAINGSISFGLLALIYIAGLIARVLLIARTEFDSGDLISRIFMIPLLLELVLSVFVGGVFSFVLLLGMGMSGATIEGVMVILWTLATGAVWAAFAAD